MKRKRFSNPFHRKRKADRKVALAPGTISIADDALPTSIRAIRYNQAEIKTYENVSVDQIPVASANHVVWVDVVGLGNEEMITAIGKRFNIHALSLEDVVNTHQRPKIEVYDDHLYIVARMPQNNGHSSNGHLDLEQVSLFVELLEMCRESCADLRDLQMAAASMRMNEVMKVLTVIATIFMPLSFIAGLYGMNFSTSVSPWNMPETQWYFGYPFALLMMALVSCGMFVFFYRKRWIGRS